MDSRPSDPTYAISAPESVAVAALDEAPVDEAPVDEAPVGTVVSEVSAVVGGLGVSGPVGRLEGLEELEGLEDSKGVVMVLVTTTTGCLTLQGT